MPQKGNSGPFEFVDVTAQRQIDVAVRRHDIDTIYHLAAILSAVAEEKPHVAWNVNMGGLYRTLEVARANRCAVFVPSSIGAFGPSTPREETPQDTVQRPTTIYGVTKAAGELLCDYYHSRFEVDTRDKREHKDWYEIIGNDAAAGSASDDPGAFPLAGWRVDPDGEDGQITIKTQIQIVF